ncbi:hypothetical protein MNBD_ALPHA09-812 [hydrothermal vent metagenome]|uniref:histidine kinase n=1 Tax=hydrothermal vent metagenome TaxID=652676 RepID=A0A3B0TS29_9ZZZZ
MDVAGDPSRKNEAGIPADGGLEAGRRVAMGICVSRHPHDELRALERRSDLAWLWDAERKRLVWANRAGLAFWGETTVLDLIDRRMDGTDAAIARMGALAASLEPGASTVETLVFDIGGRTEALQATCRRVILEDGRPGLLVVREPEEAVGPAPVATRSALLEAVIGQMPVPVVVFDRHGSLLYQNTAASEGLPSGRAVSGSGMDADEGSEDRMDGGGLFATWLGDAARAEALMARALARGSFSEAEILHTRFGPRAHRINARRLAAPVVGRLAVFMVFEDIEDRRRHEQRQAEALGAIEAVLAAADATFEIDAGGALVDIGGAAERILGKGIGVLIGTPWDDVMAALGVEGAVPFATRQARAEPWREILATSAIDAPALAVSAVPISGADGTTVGFGGLILALDAPTVAAFDDRRGEASAKRQAKTAPSDEEEFLADMQNDREPAAEANKSDGDLTAAPAVEPVPKEGTAKGEKVGRDDAATFSAIARALDSARKPVESPPVETPAGGATLRVVGGVEAPEPQPRQRPQRQVPVSEPVEETPARTEPSENALATGKPTLIHRHFVILGANDMAARLLGHDTAGSVMQDTNLLNLMPDERARLFSLQSRFDDHDLPKFGRIDGVTLKARRKDRTTLDIEASFEEVDYRGDTAVRIVFEAAKPASRALAEPVPEEQAQSGSVLPDAQNLPSEKLPQTGPQPGETALLDAVAREAELRAVINTAADGIATIDAQGRVVTLNASAEAIFGVEASTAAGRKFDELFEPQSAGTIKTYIASITSSDATRLHREGHEVRGKRPDGGHIPLFVTIGRMNIDEGLRYCAVIRDISQWKQTEESLRLAKERAEEDSAKKSDFLARISHELRTPLNAIIGFSEVMSAEKFGPIANDRYKGYLHDIRSSGDHLLSLINDLLDLSKIEAGKLDLNFTSVDIAHIIEQGVSIIQPQANRARVIVRVSLPDHLPPVVADERSLRQIVLNLLSNAVKFTPAGGQVILSAVVDEQGRLQIRVRDTGVGMSRDEIDQAMEPFRQVGTPGQIDALGKNDHAGTGLGLPLTKALTEANRAEFLIESTPSAGTLVNITFPTNRVLDG